MTVRPVRSAYGPDPAQFGDLYRPSGSAAGTVVVIHGGFWRARYDLSLGAPLAADLAARGLHAWNLEYRRVGNGGGWPNTFADVAAGVDHLAELDVDTSRVVVIGHSAGGHLAAWLAGRSTLDPTEVGATPVIAIAAVIAQAGVLDLASAAAARIGNGAAVDLMGTGPQPANDERWRIADPMRHLPVPANVLCLHSRRDDEVPFDQSVDYVSAARAAGTDANLIETSGDHYTLIDPATADWRIATDELLRLLQA